MIKKLNKSIKVRTERRMFKIQKKSLVIGLYGCILIIGCIWNLNVAAELPFFMPDLTAKEFYDFEVKPDASMTINIGGQEFIISAKFSSTSEHKWNYLGSPENGWEPQIEELTKEEYSIKASENEYKLERRIKQFPFHIDIEDTITNLTDSIIGLIIENSLTPYSQGGKVELLLSWVLFREKQMHLIFKYLLKNAL